MKLKLQFVCLLLLFYVAVIFSDPIGTLLLTNNPNRESAGDLILMNLETGKKDTLVRASDSMVPFSPCFSPDGKKVAYMVKDRNGGNKKRIRIIDLFTRQITGLGPDSTLNHLALSWAGKHIYASYNWCTSLQRINVETGIIDTAFTFQALFDKAYWGNPGYTPGIWGQGNVCRDETRGAYVLTRAINNVLTYDTVTKREVNHSFGGTKATCQAAMSPNGKWVICTNHSTDVIHPAEDSSKIHRSIYNYVFWFNRWSYNSDDDLTFYNQSDSCFYRYNLTEQKTAFLLKGLCVWNWDVRGWVLDTLAPQSPANLSAPKITENSITLQWTAPASGPSPVGYVIERNGVRIGSTAALTFTDSNLTATTAYNYSIYSRTNGVKWSVPLTGTFSTGTDQNPPKLIGVYAFGTNVDLIFSEPLNAASVTNTANYTFTPTLSVTAAVLKAPKRVRLTTANTGGITNSIISVSGVKDVSLNSVAGATDTLSIVSNLTVSTGRTCGWAAIDSGVLYWTDDDYPPAAMPTKPARYGDLPFLQTSINDGTVKADSTYLTFNINRKMIVMIIGTAPWCTEANGWTKTGDDIGGWLISTKVFEPGTVVLKGRGGAKYSTYVVGFKTWTPNDVSSLERLGSPAVGLPLLALSPSPSIGGNVAITYQAPLAGHVRISIYDARGKLISMPVNGNKEVGRYRVLLAGTDSRHSRLQSGVYFCKLSVNNKHIRTARFVVVQ